MATSDRPETTTSDERSLRARFPDDRTHAVYLVGAVALLALVARLILLGDRVAHWDEARVGYWILHYVDTGSFAYRRIIHGPFIQHVNRWLFPILGANDFTMRLPVALVSILLPLSALLFREHLRKVEMVAMALFLSFNPVVLYYSRFMRSDVLVAAFMFVAVGLLVRTYDTRKVRYLVGAAAFAALGFASKENAAVYVATWIGATALLADQALYRPREYDSGWDLVVAKARPLYRNRLGPWLGALGTAVAGLLAAIGLHPDATDDGTESDAEVPNGGELADGGFLPSAPSADERHSALVTLALPFRFVFYLAVPAFVFLALTLFFYAPRGAGVEGLRYPPAPPSEGAVGFWQGFASPDAFATMVDATLDRFVQEFGTWITQAGESGDKSVFAVYAEFLGRFVRVMLTNALALTAFAVFGTLLERYGSGTSRNLVLFMAYAGFVSVLGYPLGTDIFGAWIVVHALVPLAVPAAVGLAKVFDWGYEAFADDDAVDVGIAAVLLLLVGAQVATVAVSGVYVDDQADSNYLVQYAQPGGDPRSELQTIGAVADDGEANDTDVLLYYGEPDDQYKSGYAYVDEDESAFDSSTWDLQPLCASWYDSLPLPWYLEKDEASVSCERDLADLRDRLDESAPPVIITQLEDTTVPEETLEERYEGSTYAMRTYGTRTTFWIREDLAGGTE